MICGGEATCACASGDASNDQTNSVAVAA